MAFGARWIPHLVHCIGDLLDGGIEIGCDLIFARGEQRGLGKADSEAARRHLERQAAALDLLLQCLGQNRQQVRDSFNP